MISKPIWRNLFYKLSEKYPDCYLLNFSIQKICSNGHIDEISHYTSSSTNFNIFHNVLVNLIEKLSKKTEEELIIDQLFFDFLVKQTKKIINFFTQRKLHVIINIHIFIHIVYFVN